jgi:hypothetical protein
MNSSVETLKAALTSPARSYLWDVIFPVPFGGGDMQLMMVRAQTTSVPSVAVGQIKVPYRQTGGVAYHGKLQYSQQWDVEFVEGEDAEMFSEFVRGLSFVVDPASGLGLPDYALKQPVVLTLDSTMDLPYKAIQLYGCWVSKVGDINLDMKSDAEIRVKATLSFDYWLSL